ncbi:MAG: hypothetical protein WD512_00980 [Candidatus Paceibacterota bacterium]
MTKVNSRGLVASIWEINKGKSGVYSNHDEILKGLVVRVSPNSRAKCKFCGRRIVKGSVRLVCNGRYRYTFNGRQYISNYDYFLCYECYNSQLCQSIVMLKDAKKRYNRFIKTKGGKMGIDEFKKREIMDRVLEGL